MIVGSEGKLIQAGLTSKRRREIDTTIRRSNRYVANSVTESGRETAEQITVYKQNTIQGVTQVALLATLWDRAKERGLSTEVEWFDPRGKQA